MGQEFLKTIANNPSISIHLKPISTTRARTCTACTKPNNLFGSKRHQIIVSYLNIAKDYLDINIKYDWGSESRCTSCGSIDIEEDFGGNIYCSSCFAEDVSIVNLPMYHDGNNMNRNNKSDYDDKENFKKALNRYEGKQVIKFDKDNMCKSLDDYFTQRNMPISSDVKKLPLDSKGKRGKTSKGLLYAALKKIGYEDQYEDSNLICHFYWDWMLPDISHLAENILEDYDIFNEIYVSIRDVNKTSALNTEMVLYCLLKRNGHQCDRKNFKIVSTVEIYRNYVRKIETVFDIANDKYSGWAFDPSWW